MLELKYEGVVRSKKNSKQIIKNPRTGRPMIISGKLERQNETDIVQQFREQKRLACWRMLDAECEVKIELWQKDRRRHDLDNQASTILDALVHSGILVDDSVKYVPALLVFNKGVDKGNPRAEITVRKINNF